MCFTISGKEGGRSQVVEEKEEIMYIRQNKKQKLLLALLFERLVLLYLVE